jgi:hypothetical protein
MYKISYSAEDLNDVIFNRLRVFENRVLRRIFGPK